jgi:hypothetical protein
MIVFLTTADHQYTVSSIRDGEFGFPTPAVAIETYENIVRRPSVEKATYIFTDFDRLTPQELRIVADLFRAFQEAGLRALNNPAQVKLRFEYLKEMNRTGINPFTAYRADDEPKPKRFPVFLRSENDHVQSGAVLLANQTELDARLAHLRAGGVPIRGLLVIEHCPSAYSDSLWHKWGAFRIGNQIWLDHIAVDDNWLVKTGQWEKLTDRAIADEHDAVASNRYVEQISRAFNAASIEYGRADFGIVENRPVFYEINTNPYVGHYVPDPKQLRRQSQELVRRRFAGALEEIDCPETGVVEVPTNSITGISSSTALGTLIVPRG